jgi:hypothetical protein
MFCRFLPYTHETQNNGKIDGRFKCVQDADLAWLESPQACGSFAAIGHNKITIL